MEFRNEIGNSMPTLTPHTTDPRLMLAPVVARVCKLHITVLLAALVAPDVVNVDGSSSSFDVGCTACVVE